MTGKCNNFGKSSIGNMKRNRKDMHLPNDVVIEILLRLPAKLLGQCKCVCRTWNNLIQDPNFIKNHMHRPLNPVRLLAGFLKVIRMSDEGYIFTLFTDDSLSLREDIHNPLNNFPGRKMPVRNILGPVNGLYYMNYSYDHRNVSHALWNPTTSEFRELPSPSFPQPPNYENIVKYFGFGSTDDDVKVVTINAISGYKDELFRCKDAFSVVRLYSLVNDSWNDIEYDSVKLPFIVNSNPDHYNDIFTHLNGVYYWVVITDHDIMFLFDMKSEVFREVNLPALSPNMQVVNISVRDDYYSSVFMFANEYSNGERRVLKSAHMWEMKEEGKWLKMMCFDLSSTYVELDAVSYGFWKEDEIFIKTYDKFVLYDISSHETRDLDLDGLDRVILLNYKESLTSVRSRPAAVSV